MSRNSLTSTRRNRAVWDRPATGTRLLLSSFPYPVSLGNAINPLRMTLIASAPSRPPFPQRHLAADVCGLLPQMISLGYPGHRASGFAADARVPSPRMITHGSHPQRACPTTVDACGIAPRMNSRSALIGVEADACGIAPRMISRFTLIGVEADACGIAPRMISRFTLIGVEADACGIAPRMISRSALIGVEADACGIAPRMISRFTLIGVEADACGIAPRMISHVPSQAAEGALATLILTLSQSLSLRPSSSRRDNWPVAPGRGIPAPLHPRKETV